MKQLIFLALFYGFTACKSAKTFSEQTIQLPSSYGFDAHKNTTKSLFKDTLPSRNQFYSDPFLKSLLDTALKRNIDIQLLEAKIQQTKAGLSFTRCIRLPDLQAGISTGVRKFGDYTIDGVGNYDTKYSPNLSDKQRIPNPVPDYFFGVHSSWELDLWGKLKMQKVSAVRRFMASQYGRNAVITEVVSQVASSYYFLLILDEQRIKLIENIALQEAAILAVEAEFETGRTTDLAVQLTRSQLLETKKLLVEIEQSIKTHQTKLSILTGTFPHTISRTSPGTSDTLFSTLKILEPEQLLKNRPDILQTESQLLASNADLAAARKAFYPNFHLTSSLGMQAFKLALWFESPSSMAFNILGGMMMPLLNRRVLKANLMEYTGKKREALLQYEKTILIAYGEVLEWLQQSESLQKMIFLKQEELRLLEESILSVKALYATGRSTYLEKITAQGYYLQTQMELLDLNYRKISAQIGLYKAMGGGL